MNSEDIINSGLLHRNFNLAPQLVERAEGQYLYLSDRRILDGCGGAAVTSVGHSNPTIIQELTDQLQTVTYVHSLEYTTTAAEEFANNLLSGYEDIFARAYIANSGSEATEAAIKMAIQYYYEQGLTSKTEFISRYQSYHGNCLGGLSLSGHVCRSKPYLEVLSPHMHKVSAANEYRFKAEEESTQDYVNRLANELEDKILEIGPQKVAAFYAETIVGATAGCVVPPAGYFKAIRNICDKYDVLLILDEIMCGSGRTGTFFAWEQESVVPDIVTCGKALSSGFSPLSACIFNHKVLKVIQEGSGSFNNGHTYQAFPLACRAGLAVQKYVKKNKLLEAVRNNGDYLLKALKSKLKDSDIVGDIRGRGLFWAIEFVRNKTSKEPFPASLGIGLRIQQSIWKNGVAVYPGAGTIDGITGDHILIAPMFITTELDIDIIVDCIRSSVNTIEKELLGRYI
ncbi:uncharacterized protein PRCAT00001428001 [Priceomyces carsonii]|uniref:uncharacterized protein n=1 Tax=Priceomyces carsonii TaxID=28549 RepID=UPI002EDA9CFE|nr:unnamed protein product [Priceomyces carsonii]